MENFERNFSTPLPRVSADRRCFLPHFSKFSLSSILRFDQVTMLLWPQFEKDFLSTFHVPSYIYSPSP